VCLGIDRSGYIQIATVRLPPSWELNDVALLLSHHFDVTNHKRIVDSDAYTGSQAGSVGGANSDFRDPHGTPLVPKVCRAALTLDAV
jgi:hypothetical protein